MKRLNYFVFFIFFNVLFLQADQTESFDDCLEIGSELIDGCIDPIVGSYIDREIDISIPGASCLSIDRKCNTISRILGEYIKDWKGIRVGSNALNMFSMWTWNHATMTHWKKVNLSCNR